MKFYSSSTLEPEDENYYYYNYLLTNGRFSNNDKIITKGI